MTATASRTAPTYLPGKTAALSAIHELVFGNDYCPDRGAQPNAEGHYKPPRCGTTGLADDEVLKRCRTDRTGEEFAGFYDHGDLSDADDDDSRADWFVLNKLAFYCGANTEQVERLFKDGEHYKHSREPAKATEREAKLSAPRPGYPTLLAATIAKVLDDRTADRVYRVSRAKAQAEATARAWPAPMADAAYYGVLGTIAREIEPFIEADSAALLVNLLAATGVAIGSGPYLQRGVHIQRAVLNVANVGETSGGKSDSTAPLRLLFHEVANPREADGEAVADFATLVARVPTLSGLSTGEGLLWPIRDERRTQKQNKKTHQLEDVVEPGVTDKRFLVMEAEFARVFAVMGREGNTLDAIIRELYDCLPTVRSSPKGDPIVVTNPHVGMIVQITPSELARRMPDTFLTNGFTNRFSWTLTHRIHSLPNPPDYSTLVREHAAKWRTAASIASNVGHVQFDAGAEARWAIEYDALREGTRLDPEESTGDVPEAIARGHVFVMRTALIYAALEGSRHITATHLNAALAAWDYCERCAAYLFGGARARPVDTVIAEALRGRGALRREEVRGLFSGHQRAAVIQAALDALLKAGKVRTWNEPTSGRPIEWWEWIPQ